MLELVEFFRGSRTSQVIDLLYSLELHLETLELGIILQLDRIGDIGLDQLEVRILQQMIDIGRSGGDQVIDANDLVVLEQLLTQERAQKSGPAGD